MASMLQLLLPDGTSRTLEGPIKLEDVFRSLSFVPAESPVVARVEGRDVLALEDWLVPGEKVVLDWKVRGG